MLFELTCNVFDRAKKHEIEDLQIQLQQKDQEMSLMKENIEVRTWQFEACLCGYSVSANYGSDGSLYSIPSTDHISLMQQVNVNESPLLIIQ